MWLEHYRALLAEISGSDTAERLTVQVFCLEFQVLKRFGATVSHTTEPAMH